MEMTLIQKICVWAVPVLFAITVHEVAHGFVALRFGDKTAKMLGRLTLNPIKHIDLLGTIILPILCIAIGGVVFGWAKPVPVNPNNLPSRRYMAWVSLAGPVANLLMAFLWALVMKLGFWFGHEGSSAALALIYMGQAGIVINLWLGILNLLPIPPLDGGRFISAILPGKQSAAFDRLEPYGFFILIILLAVGALQMIIGPIFLVFESLIVHLFGLV